MPRKPKRKTTVKCGNPDCGRVLVIAEYNDRPRDGIPPEQIHDLRLEGDPGMSVFCTCAHYTLFSG